MDHRVYELLREFPQIFNIRDTEIHGLEDDWVIVKVAESSDDADRLEPSLDDFLKDLGRFEPEIYGRWPEVDDDRWMDAPLPPGIDIPRNRLGAFLGRPRPGAIGSLRRRIRSKFAGSPSAPTTTGLVPPPDALAVYLPFHLFPDMWGIYLLDVGVESLATDIRYIAGLLGRSISPMDARRVSCAYLFHHEAYHCAVESFSVRCELPTRKPVYKTGAMRLYNRGYVHGAPHEEALATAYGIRKVKAHVLLPRPDLDVAVQALKVYMTLCQPEYSTGLDYLDDIKFDGLERVFIEEVMRVSSGRALPHSTWDIGTFMMTPLIQRN